MFRFETLEVWKKSQQLCSDILLEVKKLPVEYRYTIGSNLIRAALSIPNNIAEGSGRTSKREAVQFYNIARGSTFEVVNVSIVLRNQQLLSAPRFEAIYNQSEEVCRMLSGLMKQQAQTRAKSLEGGA